MNEVWRLKRIKLSMATILALLLMLHHSLSLCWSLNWEGLALLRFRERVVRDPFGALSNWNDRGVEADPCSWFGVECSDGKVIILNLEDLCLEGILAPELGKLTYIKSIILRNNSFWGNIPVEIAELKELEVLDLGYNNFSGPFPTDLGNNLSLSILLLDNNKFLGSLSPELYKLTALSEFQVDENQLTRAALGASCNSRSSAWNAVRDGNVVQRRILQVSDSPNRAKAKSDKRNKRNRKPSQSSSLSLSPSPSTSPLPPIFSPSLTPSDSPSSFFSFPPSASISLPPESPYASPLDSLAPSPSPMPPPSPAPPSPPPDSEPPLYHPAPLPSPDSFPDQSVQQKSKSKNGKIIIWSGVTGGSLFIICSILGIFLCRSSKVVTVKPWATGLSGQLQKAFVTGVPKLQRSELETACEDFSNVIGSLSDGMVYKGTLSSGVEIAVKSIAVKSAADWSKSLEAQFRNKIDTLSKMNHKNFVNLIGYCEEEKPFTRMLVFEYAPNGTLFEHLHIKEAEHLDWAMRLRIAMGMAYCLEHMHQLTPPITHRNLHSASVYLTEDYAAKISDFDFCHEATATKTGSAATELLETPSPDPETNVYSFGVILYEMVTGKLPFSVGDSLVDWASDYLKGEQPVTEMADPTLTSFREEVLEELYEVIKDCVHHDPKHRPTMKEVTAKLKEITSMGPDGATPKLSPLWWAELEILTSETS
ncbi:probable inactive receptor-like protein kinase At3g56050 [Actinidia eriantha]|uniref:probable inactive receptor-like protein kinase At3g56050 n=1 Tax=Actinidia eriantha TaxID=165200 RepID=UPI00258585E1|nr:probable inactive receptor-like protein kinase At3g56050 [Actinidia eriantha]